jgi:hypothetical protein
VAHVRLVQPRPVIELVHCYDGSSLIANGWNFDVEPPSAVVGPDPDRKTSLATNAIREGFCLNAIHRSSIAHARVTRCHGVG